MTKKLNTTPQQGQAFARLQRQAVITEIAAMKQNGDLVCLTFGGEDLTIAPDGKCTIEFPGAGEMEVFITE